MKETQKIPIVKIIASPKNWIDSQAVDQLKETAKLKGMVLAVGLPDLHPGKQFPVGAAFVTENIFYPLLAGNDIGCGMSFWQTNLQANKVKLEKLVKKLDGLEEVWDGDISPYLQTYNLMDIEENRQLGTIGGGNHFAELQIVDSIFDESRFDSLKMDRNYCFLLTHSGSRILGQNVYLDCLNKHGSLGLESDNNILSDSAKEYLTKHNHAIAWARANRDIIARRFCEAINIEYDKRLDICHNEISQEKWGDTLYWFHRKGASSARLGPVIIPGSRGHYSYLVEPIGDQESTAYSLAHGAGRKWQRSSAKAKLSHKFKIKDLQTTQFKSRVICENKDLIYEEAPQAYKNIEVVIQDLIDEGLIRLIARFKPLITYKTRRDSCQ